MQKIQPMKNTRKASTRLQAIADQKATFHKDNKKVFKLDRKLQRKNKNINHLAAWGE